MAREHSRGALSMDRILFIVGAAPFLVLGLIHAVYSAHDAVRPRRIVPRDPAVIDAMRGAPLRLSPQTDTWRAWIGFNLSHSLGAVVFAAACLYLAIGYPATLESMFTLRLAAFAVALVYAGLARAYWFTTPFWGSAFGAAAFAGSLALYAAGG